MRSSCALCGALLLTAGPCPHCSHRCSGSCRHGALVGALVLGLAGCDATGKESFPGVAEYGVADTSRVDLDGDGYFTPEDCDDGNAAIHPEATETPGDGVDSNCDGEDDS